MRSLLCIIALVLLMIGCKPKGHINNLNNSIVGEWVEYDPNDSSAKEYLTVHLIFNSGGTGQWKLMGDLFNPNKVRESASFTWFQDGNNIIVKHNGDETNYELHGDELLRAGVFGIETFHKKR